MPLGRRNFPEQNSLAAWYIYPAKHPKSTHPKVMGEMMNKIILQLKDSSLRVGTNKTLACLPKT